MTRKRLGEILLELGVITQDQLSSALSYQRQWGHRLGVALVAKGFITEGLLVKVLSDTLRIPMVDLAKVVPDPLALRLIPLNTCVDYDLIPISLEGTKASQTLSIAMADPMNVSITDELAFTTSCKVKAFLAATSSINSAIRKYYRGEETTIQSLSPSGQKKRPSSNTGVMEVVRPGGVVERVDTNTYIEGRGAPAQAADPPEAQPIKKEPTAGGPMAVPATVPMAAPATVPGPAAMPPGVTPSQGDPPVSPDRAAEIKAKRAARLVKEASSATPGAHELTDEYLNKAQNTEMEALQKLEKYFWALMRVLVKKNMLSKEEFIRELNKID